MSLENKITDLSEHLANEMKKLKTDISRGTGYESEQFIYIVFGDTNAWLVERYNRNSNLQKTTSSGSGTTPSSITALTGLTYS